MDDLDRVFHRLVSNIRHNHPENVTMPFTVQELYETLIPYRHHRRELGIETNQEYEIALTRLLAGERDYLHTDAEMRDKLQTELSSPHFDTGAFREFASAKVSLAPEALRKIRALTAAPGDAAPAPESPGAGGAESGIGGTATAGAEGAATAAPSAVNATFAISSPGKPDAPAATAAPGAISSLLSTPVPEGCPYCGGTLPEGRSIVYCPHCGNNLSVTRCPACGSELETAWKFCITCGRSVG